MRAYFVILFFIILVSGCVNPFGDSSAGGGPGVVINSLSFAPSNIKSNQLTKLSLSIENQGDYAVEDGTGTVYIFNLPNDWTISDQSDITSYTEPFGLMAPQVRGVKKYSGEGRNFEWVLRAPLNLPKDEIFSYTAQARVCYPYKTKIWGRLEVVSENAWLQDPPSEHSIAVQQTQGPLKVEFVSKQPLMIETDVKIKVRITNVGDGVVTSNDCSVFANVVDDDEGTAINNLNRITLGDSDCTLSDDLYLEKGQAKETYITCTPPSLGTNPITTSDFTMELIYNYYSDKKASISVKGTSEDAAGGMTFGGGGATAVLTLTDLCTKTCSAAGQNEISTSKAYGICTSTTSAVTTYPGTTVDVQIAPLGGTASGTLNTALGSAYTTATIKDLKLHDVKVRDLNLQSVTIGMLDEKALSAQYAKNTKLGSSVGILSYMCSAAISDSMTVTSGGETKGTLCAGSGMSNLMLSKLLNLNGAPGDQFKDKSISGLTITSLAGRSIGTMTGGNFSSLNVEDFKVSYLNGKGVFSGAPGNFMNFTKCSTTQPVTYTAATACQCVVQLPAGYALFDGTSAAACTAACPKTVGSTKWADGGACDLNADYGDIECSGVTTYEYFSRPSVEAGTCPDTCLCYRRKTISSTEAALLCKPTA